MPPAADPTAGCGLDGANIASYVYWDDIHPTAKVQALWAAARIGKELGIGRVVPHSPLRFGWTIGIEYLQTKTYMAGELDGARQQGRRLGIEVADWPTIDGSTREIACGGICEIECHAVAGRCDLGQNHKMLLLFARP